MRWFWIVGINLNEPANLFQLLGQLRADRGAISHCCIYLFVACLPACLLTVCRSVPSSVCQSLCLHPDINLCK